MDSLATWRQEAMILWSGGCDSTYALYQHALTVPRTDPIRTVSISQGNIPNNECDKRARDKIEKWLAADGIVLNRIEVTISNFQIGDRDGGLQQPLFWLAAAIPALHQNEDLITGYIKSDDLFHHKSEFVEAFNQLILLSGGGSSKLLFPLEWSTKCDIIKYLRGTNNHNGECLLDLCWWCEKTNYNLKPKDDPEPCGCCPSCLTHNIWQRELDRLNKECSKVNPAKKVINETKKPKVKMLQSKTKTRAARIK